MRRIGWYGFIAVVACAAGWLIGTGATVGSPSWQAAVVSAVFAAGGATLAAWMQLLNRRAERRYLAAMNEDLDRIRRDPRNP